MIVLDATVVNVALPAIQDELGFSQSGLAWVVNAYLIASGTPGPRLSPRAMNSRSGSQPVSWSPPWW